MEKFQDTFLHGKKQDAEQKEKNNIHLFSLHKEANEKADM
jgi:hypothetical protein